jgi:hypothetical protein
MTRSATVLIALIALVGCESSPTQPVLEDGASGALPAASTAEGADVFLGNGNMEQDSAWYFYAPPGTSAAYVEGGGLRGSRAVALTGDGRPEDRPLVYQRLSVGDLTGRRLTLEAHVRLVDVQGPGFAIALRGDDPTLGPGGSEAFASTQGRIDIRGTADWTEYSVHLQDLDASIGTISVFLILLPGTTGNVYVDDVTLSTGVAVPETPRFELENGGFEAGDRSPDDWWRGGTTYSGFTFDWWSTGAYEGNRAVSITRQGASREDFAFWAQTLRADEFIGGSVTLHARVRTDVTGQGVSLVIRGDDTLRPADRAEAFASTQGSTMISGSSGWVERSVTLDRLPPGMESVTVYLVFLPGTTGTVYFDAVELTR